MKIKLAIALVTFLFTGTLFAQSRNVVKQVEPVNNPNHILFSPLYFFDGTFMLTYERLFRTGSIRITPSFKMQHLDDKDQSEGWGVDVGYKFFLKSRPNVPNFYVGPYALYKNIKLKVPYFYEDGMGTFTRYDIDTYNIMSAGVDTGIKFIFGRFTLDMSIGGGFRYAFIDGYTFENAGSEWKDIGYKGIVPRGNVSVGFTF